MILFYTFYIVQGIETVSYLDTGSELILDGHSGIQLEGEEISCFLGIFNSTYPFGVKCGDKYPLYVDETRRTHFGAEVLTEADIEFSGGLTVGGVNQWGLVHYDGFKDSEASSYTNKSITECGGVRMLGGYCQFSAGNSSRLIDLPDHSQIRLKLTWHFIDQWHGETAYINLGTSSTNQTVWSYTYDLSQSVDPINICGNSDYGEGKFAIPVDITYEHTSNQLLVLFGSTLEEQPCEKSWGISGIEVYIR